MKTIIILLCVGIVACNSDVHEPWESRVYKEVLKYLKSQNGAYLSQLKPPRDLKYEDFKTHHHSGVRIDVTEEGYRSYVRSIADTMELDRDEYMNLLDLGSNGSLETEMFNSFEYANSKGFLRFGIVAAFPRGVKGNMDVAAAIMTVRFEFKEEDVVETLKKKTTGWWLNKKTTYYIDRQVTKFNTQLSSSENNAIKRGYRQKCYSSLILFFQM